MGGGGKIEITKYFMSMHYGICTGPIDALRGIITKEKEAWAGLKIAQENFIIEKGELFGGREKEGGVQGVCYYLPGEDDQILDDLLAQKLGRSGGTDAPGYRGIASIFLVGPRGTPYENFSGWAESTEGRKGFYWTANVPYLPGTWVKVRRRPRGLNAATAMILTAGSNEFPYDVKDVGGLGGSTGFSISRDWLVRYTPSGDLEWWYLSDGGVLGGVYYAVSPRAPIMAGSMGVPAIDDNGTAWFAAPVNTGFGVVKRLWSCSPGGEPAGTDTDAASAIFSHTRVVNGQIYTAYSVTAGYLLNITDIPIAQSGRDFCEGRDGATVILLQPTGSSDAFTLNVDGTDHLFTGLTTRSGASAARVVYVPTAQHYFVHSDGNYYLIDDQTFVIKDSGPALWDAPVGSSPTHFPTDGTARSFWDDFTEYSLEDASVIRTVSPTAWTSGGTTDSIYDATNNAIWGKGSGTPLTVRYLDRGDFDANPSHIIFESLTNTDWGMGWLSSSIDIDSFELAGDTLFDEGFGLSLLWTRQAKIENFIKEILDHIQGVLFVDPTTGLLTLKLVRADYDPETLPLITPSNARMSNFDRKLWGDIANEITVTWTNPLNEEEETVTVQDLASIAAQGAVITDSRNYYGVRSAQLASKLAQRDLRTAGAPLARCDVQIDRSLYFARPASVFRVTWPEHGLSEIVMRATEVDYGKPGDPRISMTLLEDVYGLDAGEYIEPPSTIWEDPSEAPLPLTIQRAITLPAYMAANAASDWESSAVYPEVLTGVLGTTTSEDTFSIELWNEQADTTGTLTWQQIGDLNVIGHALTDGTLDPEAVTTGVTFNTFIGDTSPVTSAFVLIGDAAEEASEIALITASAGGVYTLSRGVLDTIPRAWPIGTPVWFIDSATVFEDTIPRAAGEDVSYKLLPRTSLGLLPLGAATPLDYTLSDRPWLPLRPANVAIDGVFFNTVATPVDATAMTDVPTSWSNRNRLLEDTEVFAWTDGDIAPETGQTTTITILALDGTVLTVHNALSGTSFDIPIASFAGNAISRVRFSSERTDADGTFESLQAHEIFVQTAPITFDQDSITFDADTITWDEA